MGGAHPLPERGSNLTIGFGLVNVGVKYAPIVDSKGKRVSGKYVDPLDKGPVKQQYVNAAGKPVEQVTAYPSEDGALVVLTPGELQALKSERDGRLELKAYVDPMDVDLLYFEKSYVMWPAKGQEPSYDVLASVLENSGRYLVGTTVLDKSTKVMLLRFAQGCIFGHVLTYDANVRWNTHGLVVGAAGERPAADEALVNLAEQVFEGLDDTFDFGAVEDEYDQRLRAAIAARAKDEPIPIQPTTEPIAATSLLDALKASVEAAKGSKPKAKPKPRAAAKSKVSKPRVAA